jgi:predicted NAD/FAD-binding protein
VSIESRHGRELFDHVLFACHSDQALRLLGDDATPTERELLSAFPYERNVATLHTDASLLPRSKRAWACWNYLAPEDDPGRATVTYNMNLLQGLTAPEAFLVTLNGEDRIDPRRILRQFVYHHPVFTVERERIQQRHAELINCRRTSFCGAYWRNGFHEDGVTSALAVCRTLEQEEADAQLLVRGMGQPSALVSR